MNLCINCLHFKENGRMWYDKYCSEPSLEFEKTVDPVTGKVAYKSTSDLGRVIITDKPWPYARDINRDGTCPFFDSIQRQQEPRDV